MAQIAERPGSAAGLYVVGPTRRGSIWAFLCPRCDSAEVEDADAANTQCTAKWLDGQSLQWDDREWVCFDTDPFEGEDIPLNSKRFTYYSAIARALGAKRQRVQLPKCVTDKISEQYGASETGFKQKAASS